MLSLRLIIVLLYCSISINYIQTSTDIVLSLDGFPDIAYSLPILLGEPPQLLKVILDTGSSNFAIAGIKIPDRLDIPFFSKSSSTTFNNTFKPVSERYFEGSWSGTIGVDFFAFDNFNHSFPVYISIIEQVSTGFFVGDWSGILGLAYPVLAKPDASITPVFDSLVQYLSYPHVFALQLCAPHINTSIEGDIISLGGNFSIGYGLDLIDGDYQSLGYMYADIVKQSFYEVLITSISVSGVELGLPCSNYNNKYTIVDSGTTDLVFNEDTYNALIQVLKKHTEVLSSGSSPPASFWKGDSVISLNIDHDFKMFPTFSISLQSHNSTKQLRISVPPQLYLKRVTERSSQQMCIVPANECYLFKIGISSGNIATILGMLLFQGYATQFNIESNQIGFQITGCNLYNGGKDRLSLKLLSPSNESCEYLESSNSYWVVWLTVSLVIVFVLCAVIALVILVFKIKRRDTSNVSNKVENSNNNDNPLECNPETYKLMDNDDELNS